eukprot:1397454-Amphidinium_carterae.1
MNGLRVVASESRRAAPQYSFGFSFPNLTILGWELDSLQRKHFRPPIPFSTKAKQKNFKSI